MNNKSKSAAQNTEVNDQFAKDSQGAEQNAEMFALLGIVPAKEIRQKLQEAGQAEAERRGVDPKVAKSVIDSMLTTFDAHVSDNDEGDQDDLEAAI